MGTVDGKKSATFHSPSDPPVSPIINVDLCVGWNSFLVPSSRCCGETYFNIEFGVHGVYENVALLFPSTVAVLGSLDVFATPAVSY